MQRLSLNVYMYVCNSVQKGGEANRLIPEPLIITLKSRASLCALGKILCTRLYICMYVYEQEEFVVSFAVFLQVSRA